MPERDLPTAADYSWAIVALDIAILQRSNRLARLGALAPFGLADYIDTLNTRMQARRDRFKAAVDAALDERGEA